MVYLQISDKIGNQQFSCHAELLKSVLVSLISETQSSLLKILHNFKTLWMKEKFVPI